MRIQHRIIVAAAAAVLTQTPAAAQIRGRTGAGESSRSRTSSTAVATSDADTRSLLGLALGVSGTDRYTLGLLVTDVVRGSSAAAAGIDEGSRVAELNGIDLRLSQSDVGDRDVADAIQRRLARSLRTVQPGATVRARFYEGSRLRAVSLRAAGSPTVAQSAKESGMVVGVFTDKAPPPASLAEIMKTISLLQGQLKRLSESDSASGMNEALVAAERDMGGVRQRLSDAEAVQRRRAVSTRGQSDEAQGETVAGLRLAPVTDDLAAYFGEGSQNGLLVVEADASWAPVRAGDIILRVDDMAVNRERLRDAHDSRDPTRVSLLRRFRQVTVTLHERE